MVIQSYIPYTGRMFARLIICTPSGRREYSVKEVGY